MENSNPNESGRNAKQRHIDKLYLKQFSELRKLKADKSKTLSEKVKAKRLIVIKYKALRRKVNAKHL